MPCLAGSETSAGAWRILTTTTAMATPSAIMQADTATSAATYTGGVEAGLERVPRRSLPEGREAAPACASAWSGAGAEAVDDRLGFCLGGSYSRLQGKHRHVIAGLQR